MTQPRPLARSLAPLPDESLPGFFLRLACRLDTSPSELVVRTGLVNRAHLAVLPMPLLISLSGDQRHNLAKMIKATDAEVDAMLLDSYSDRYPPAAASGRNGLANFQQRWLFLHATRYCPQCLAGRDTAVEQAFGGPWKNSWRLPPVFACLEHRRFLEHVCPECKSLVLLTTTRSSAGHLPRWNRDGLHPAQCRAFLEGECGRRLDQEDSTAQPLSTEYSQFQRFLLDLLDRNGPQSIDVLGHPASPGHYFTDLRTTCHLLRASWPNSRYLLDDQKLTEFLDGDSSEDTATLSKSKFVRTISDMPQMASRPQAALLMAADRLLRPDDHGDFADHLRTLLHDNERRPSKVDWTRAFLEARPKCSEGFLQSVSSVVQTYAKTNKARNLKEPILTTRFCPEHIPQFLENDWYQKYFAHMDGIATVHLRRTAALRLFQTAAGGPIQKAADRMGPFLTNSGAISRIADSPKCVHRWARTRPDPLEFESAIRSLAAELDSRDDLIDYERRRKALAAWCIAPETWATICSRMVNPQYGGGWNPDFTDRKRNIASVMLWTLMTQGEHVFAPTPIANQQDPETQRKWEVSVAAFWARQRHSVRRPTDNQLMALLEEYAAYLTPIIDRTGSAPTETSPWG
ncbi:TniQ family protein [Streptomyces tauricus]|uniref:TniQ family protein n=1 Tax=Streptomyces tauricus TaxID=68274 RepID=UPI00224404D3|nr:TniQ family protein [Streptomyces tauricus]MCW8101653.1 TniQ family protein [Streptomyces tauricus]